MSTSKSSSETAIPSQEALSLSASLFTSSVASWIPANFGHVVPPAEAEKEWQALLRSAGEGKDRLGLGHPAISAPKANGGGYKGGIQGLEKSMKNGKRKAVEAEIESGNQVDKLEEDESEEEESRANMVGKRKRQGVPDLLGGKKKKKAEKEKEKEKLSAVTSTASSSARVSPAPAVASTAEEEGGAATSLPAPPAEDAGSATVSAVETDPPGPSILGPNQVSAPTPSPLPSLGPTPSTSTLQSAPTSPVRSKSALKRERKKLRKLAELAQKNPPA